MMYKSFFLFIVSAFLVVLTSCSPVEDVNNPVPTKEQRYENQAFKEIQVNQKEDNVIVTGKARVFEGVFQYAIIKGNTIVKEDYYQTDGAPAWGEFEITIDKGLQATELELFVYSAKDGSKIDVLKIPITNH
ncbi:Gmad2 immunoglobulin-like domain-containing protein [Peribacillus acanthi]|uniref:Gmad2 immunoglobulin-like domain-containing protein n=1 Tax=Peribacillus acanthi TaxID=2171554 RepID=UPI000D3EA23E|nr:Gmad2 immunoglobulin-like domain-containing protein [Peribacillus acanthi]